MSFLRAFAVLALALFAAPRLAQADAPFAPLPDETHLAAEHDLAFGVYASGWAGSYLAGGVGGRLRWEIFDDFGIELFGEAHVVESGSGIRHDHQVGFNVYVPIRLGAGLRLRPLLGMCAVISMVEPTEQLAPRADDILFGAHAGLSLEWSANEWLALFVEAQGVGWAGHDRSLNRWTGAISDTYVPFGTAQVILGTSAHFDL
ncbi:MAG: hypothetical protein K1X94_19860 [Sandaracinaceae bacterium]|nr:hypothetical protein [Sandaracinaceae bacterium]